MDMQKQTEKLAHAKCANFMDGQCIPQDRPCHVINALWPDRDHRPIACKWFLDAILPTDKVLETIIRPMQEGEVAPPPTEPLGKRCALCDKPFTPASNRQRYCTACGRENERRKANARQRKSYAKKKA